MFDKTPDYNENKRVENFQLLDYLCYKPIIESVLLSYTIMSHLAFKVV